MQQIGNLEKINFDRDQIKIGVNVLNLHCSNWIDIKSCEFLDIVAIIE